MKRRHSATLYRPDMCKERYIILMTEQSYDKNYAKVGLSWAWLGFTGGPALGPGWVRVGEVRLGPSLGWALGRVLRPKLGFAEV
jgi:hypothetical protein